jgi:hypothetical protein
MKENLRLDRKESSISSQNYQLFGLGKPLNIKDWEKGDKLWERGGEISLRLQVVTRIPNIQKNHLRKLFL